MRKRNSNMSSSFTNNSNGNDAPDDNTTKLMRKVFVFTFPPVPHAYNISPFAIKLESFLRIHEIPYENVYTSKFSSKRSTIPYIRLDDKETGEEICDTNVILPFLREEFGLKENTSVDPMEMAVTHAMMRMLEEHTTQIGFYYRYGLHMPEFSESLDLANRMFEAEKSSKGRLISKAWFRVQPKVTKAKTKARGLIRHEPDELWSFTFDDLRALSTYLGDDKRYFFGTTATTLDTVVFGHLSQFLYIPLDFPQKQFIQEECSNLVHFMERFKQEYWPDWETKCEKVPNAKYAKTNSGVAGSSKRRQAYLLVAGGLGALVAAAWLSKQQLRY